MNQPGRPIAAAGCLLLAAIALAAPSPAQIYKWVDEDGTVHFGNNPPPQAAAEVMPESQPRPRVDKGRTASDDAEAADDEVEAPPIADDVETTEIIVEDGSGDVVVVDDGQGDLATRRRANSPRNRPGEPIRQPNRQPRRRR